MKREVLAFAFVLTATSISWSDNTGIEMIQAFKKCDQYKSGSYSRWQIRELVSARANCDYLRGYVIGVAESMQADGMIAFPKDTTYGHIWTAVRKYLENHPEELNENQFDVSRKALLKAFSMEEKPNR